MQFSVTVSAQNIALLGFFEKHFFGSVSPDIADVVFFFSTVPVVKIKATDMVFRAFLAFRCPQLFQQPKFYSSPSSILVAASRFFSGIGFLPSLLPRPPTFFADCIFAVRRIFHTAISKRVERQGLSAFVACFIHAVYMPTTHIFQKGVR